MNDLNAELISKWREETGQGGPDDILKREQFCTMMTLGLLTSLNKYIKDMSEGNKSGFIYACCSILQPFADSGGRGSEALSRLMGLGVIDEFPSITEAKKQSVSELLEHKITVQKHKSGNSEVKAKIHFDAHVPDDSGETYWQENHYRSTCWAKIKFIVPKYGLDSLIVDMQDKLETLR